MIEARRGFGLTENYGCLELFKLLSRRLAMMYNLQSSRSVHRTDLAVDVVFEFISMQAGGSGYELFQPATALKQPFAERNSCRPCVVVPS